MPGTKCGFAISATSARTFGRPNLALSSPFGSMSDSAMLPSARGY